MFRSHFQLKRSILLPAPISEVWTFFSNPENLRQITPPSMDFTITSEPQTEMYPGQIISYTVKPLCNIPLVWVTEITQVRKPHYFVDEQRYGPYLMWHHQHIFEESPDGIIAKDIVDYVLPGGLLAPFIQSGIVDYQLKKIFHYRAQQLSVLFPGAQKIQG